MISMEASMMSALVLAGVMFIFLGLELPVSGAVCCIS